MQGLRESLEDKEGGSGGGQFDAAHAGPASVFGPESFKDADEEFSYLDYEVSGQRIRLARVNEFASDDPGEAGAVFVWFLQTEEVSADLFIAVADSDRARGRQWYEDLAAPANGPSVWDRGDRQQRFRVARSWLDKSPDIDGSAVPLFAPGLGDSGDRYRLVGATESRGRELNPAGAMPMQQISYDLAAAFCEALGLRLPKLEVWRTVAAPVVQGLDAARAQNLGLNLRDETWGVQVRYEQQNTFSPAMLNWRADWFGANAAAPQSELAIFGDPNGGNFNDGYLYFAPTGRQQDTNTWHDVVGNVAEFVTQGDGSAGNVYVVGGSAMSLPTQNAGELEQVASSRALRQGGFADVGFRLALRVPKEAFVTTVAQRVERQLRSAPFTWAAAP